MTAPSAEEPSQDELKEMRARLQSLEQHNQAELESISGMGGQLDAAAVALIRLNAFVNFIFARLGNASPELRQLLSTQFEVEYQGKLAESLKAVKAEIRKAMLASGASVSPQQQLQMWKQQNSHGGSAPPGLR